MISILYLWLVLAYSIGFTSFAERHITLPFLDFPVFIGEIFLIITFSLYLIYMRSERLFQGWHRWLWVYLGFVVIKANVGYFEYGALAFRNSAMFYYPLYAVVAYQLEYRFLKKDMVVFPLAVFLGVCLAFNVCNAYFYYVYGVLIMVMGYQLNIIGVSWIYYALLMLKISFNDTRTIFISGLAGLVYIPIAFISAFLKKSRVLVGIMVALVVLASFWFLGDKDKIESIIGLRKTIEGYQKAVALIDKQGDIQLGEYDIKLYETERELRDRIEERKATGGVSEIERANIVWRLLVWEDVVREVVKKEAFFGIGFGKPFRSRNAEVLKWCKGEWVGWLEPHNSYLHIIYRSGLVGILLIFLFVCLVVKRIIISITQKRVVGMLLMSVVVYWMVAGCFAVIFELPQFAIPFWILLGMGFRFADGKV